MNPTRFRVLRVMQDSSIHRMLTKPHAGQAPGIPADKAGISLEIQGNYNPIIWGCVGVYRISVGLHRGIGSGIISGSNFGGKLKLWS